MRSGIALATGVVLLMAAYSAVAQQPVVTPKKSVDSAPWHVAKVAKLSRARGGTETSASVATPQKYLSIQVDFKVPSKQQKKHKFRVTNRKGEEVGELWGWNDGRSLVIFEGNWGSLVGLYLDSSGHREPLFNTGITKPVVKTTRPPVVQTTRPPVVARTETVVDDRTGIVVGGRRDVVVDHTDVVVHDGPDRVVVHEGSDSVVVHDHGHHDRVVVHHGSPSVTHVGGPNVTHVHGGGSVTHVHKHPGECTGEGCAACAAAAAVAKAAGEGCPGGEGCAACKAAGKGPTAGCADCAAAAQASGAGAGEGCAPGEGSGSGEGCAPGEGPGKGPGTGSPGECAKACPCGPNCVCPARSSQGGCNGQSPACTCPCDGKSPGEGGPGMGPGKGGPGKGGPGEKGPGMRGPGGYGPVASAGGAIAGMKPEPKVPGFVLYVLAGEETGPGKLYQVDEHGRVLGVVNLPFTGTGVDLHREHGLVVAIPRDGGKIMHVDDTGKLSTLLEKDKTLVHPVDVAMGGDSDTVVVADNIADVMATTTSGGAQPKVYQRLEGQKWAAQEMSVAVTKDKHVILGTDGDKGIYRMHGRDTSTSGEPVLPGPGGVAADPKSLRWAATQDSNQIYVFEGAEVEKKLRLPPKKSHYRNGKLSFSPAGSVCVAARDSDKATGEVWLLMYNIEEDEIRSLFPWKYERMTDFVVGPRMFWDRKSPNSYKSTY